MPAVFGKVYNMLEVSITFFFVLKITLLKIYCKISFYILVM